MDTTERIQITLDRIDCIGTCESNTEKGDFTWSLRVDNQVVSERFRRLNGVTKLRDNDNIFPAESTVITVGPNFYVRVIAEEWDKPGDLWLAWQATQEKVYVTRDLPKSDTLQVGATGCGLLFAFSFKR